ncbi:uncharacterized protein LOC114270615 [Camellia sinensis]|uniref:uncharacterized protein LOC114270615 n=1 Tax=Camellia sinensis TaxID=4442 RepID=UPI0010360B5A|nr:uncharacterized protein LOC114270615 [Camellia sinensis]
MDSMKDASENFDSQQWSKEEVFKSKEELLGWVRDVGRKNGFVIVIKISDYGGGQRTPRIFLACERSGQYRAHKKLEGDDSSKKIVKITGTKKCGRPFESRARKLMADDDWMVDVACGMHNHAPAKHFEGHSFARRLSKEETSLLVDMSKSMVRPKQILVTLKRKDALNVTTMKTIYNVHHRNNVIEKAGRSQMQHLLGELEKHNYIEWHRCDNNTMTITDLFWAHPVSLDLLPSFPKRIDKYVWVLTTLRSLLDDIAIPEVIVTDRELALMNAIDRLEYNEHLARLLADFATYPEAVQYVSQSWLIPYKDKFVAVWTDSCMHFENVTTNRAESARAKLKRQLGSNQVNFECSWTKIHSLLELQHVDIKASFEKRLTIVQHQFKQSHFIELRGNISITALDHVLAESKRANDVGIDASLEILHKLGEIADPQSSFLIEPDVKLNPRGKAHKKIDVSTRRDPCAFELVQSGHDSHSPMGTQIPTQDSVKVYRMRTSTTYSYVDALPVGLKPYIRLIKDVDANGNCGFRAIAGLMGLTEAEWGEVRRDLLQE